MIKLTEEHYQIAALGDGSTFRSYEGKIVAHFLEIAR